MYFVAINKFFMVAILKNKVADKKQVKSPKRL